MNNSKLAAGVAAALILGGLGSQAQADGPTIKPGLWEVRVVKQLVNGVDQAAQLAASQEKMKAALAKLSPEQRKKMEASMAAMGGDSATRLCISPAMVATQDKPVMPADAQCDPPVTKKSGNRTDYAFSCKQGGQTVKGKGQSEVSPERVISRMDMTSSGPQSQHRMETESDMRFISADCGNVKPLDQMAVKPPPKR